MYSGAPSTGLRGEREDITLSWGGGGSPPPLPPICNRFGLSSRFTHACGVSGDGGSGIRNVHRVSPTTGGVCGGPTVCGVRWGFSGGESVVPEI